MKPTNPMQQLQQWKANNTKRLVSDGGVSVNGVHPNALKIEPVKSAIKNCERNCETAKEIAKLRNEAKHSEPLIILAL